MVSRRKQDLNKQDLRAGSPADHYRALHQGFGWQVPAFFNMAQACCGRWAAQPQTSDAIAIREHVAGQGPGRSWSFAQLQDAAGAHHADDRADTEGARLQANADPVQRR
mgnify:CR=1 FL=1